VRTKLDGLLLRWVLPAVSPRRLLHTREDGDNGSQMKGPGRPPRVRSTLKRCACRLHSCHGLCTGTCAVSCPRPDTPPRCRSAEHQGTNFFHLALIAAYIVIPAFLQNPRLGIFSLCVVAVLAVAVCWRMQATHKQRTANGQAKNAVPQKGARSAETPRPVHKRGKQGLTVVHQDGWLIMWLCVDGMCLTYVVRSSVPKLLCFSEEGAGADRISEVVLAELQKAYRLTLAEGLVGAACFMYFACVLCLLLCL
jgi:hypothetical protein